MQLSVDMGQIALIFFQLIMLVITFFVHSRQLSAVDLEKRDRGNFGATVANALRAANDALAGIEKIDKELYRDLARKHALLLQEVEDLKVKNSALEESLKSLANKLASRDRADKYAQRITQPNEQAQLSQTIPDGQDPLEFLKATGQAVPLNDHQKPFPPNVSSFGKMATKG